MKKLVRDKIPKIIEERGETPIVTRAAILEMPDLLADKLREEVSEYLADYDPAELQDILTVVFEIATRHGIDRAELLEMERQKTKARGGFRLGVVWHGNQK